MTRNLIIMGCATLLAMAVSGAAIAGSISDADGDGVPDEFDNCQVIPNGPLAMDINGCGQTDFDQDGWGNACDADTSNNFVVDLVDLGEILTFLGSTTNPQQDISCNGVVDLVDMGRVLTDLGNSPPGDSGLACAGTIPCPGP